MNTIAFQVPGAPQGKARPRFRVARTRGGKQFVSVYTPAETMAYEKTIAKAARIAMRAAEPMTGPVELNVTAVLPVPESWPVNKRNAALTGNLRPTVKPDFDNIEKVVADAIKGVVLNDDCQVCLWSGGKKYGPEPMLLVEVHALDRALLPLFRAAE